LSSNIGGSEILNRAMRNFLVPPTPYSSDCLRPIFHAVRNTRTKSDARLSGRERSRLRKGRENGFLRARASGGQETVQAFSLWCWRLKIPTIWSQPRTARSRYGQIRLDMFTTNHMLSPKGLKELQSLAPACRISPHDGCWDRVPIRELDRLCRVIFHAVTREANCEPNRSKETGELRKPGKLFQVA
jgi:hypothetical protein